MDALGSSGTLRQGPRDTGTVGKSLRYQHGRRRKHPNDERLSSPPGGMVKAKSVGLAESTRILFRLAFIIKQPSFYYSYTTGLKITNAYCG